MPDARHSWEEVGKVLDGLGLKLKMHAEKARDEAAGAELGDALKQAASTIDGAMDALGEAVRDQAIREDVRRFGSALSDAIGNTLNEAARNIRGGQHPD